METWVGGWSPAPVGVPPFAQRASLAEAWVALGPR